MAKVEFKGDLHLHTYYSDGDESPVFMAAKAREAGLDYAAVTDHRVYDSSLEAIREAAKYRFDILLFPGEEVSYEPGLGHVLSINADESIDKKLGINGEKDNLKSIIDRLHRENALEIEDRELLEGVDSKLYAYIFGVVNMIRRAGGFAIIAHPYWKSNNVFDMISLTYEQVLKDGYFDAIEIFGDTSFEDKMLSLSRLQAELSSKDGIAIVGNSDAHRAASHTLGKIWTVAFTEQLDRNSILNAIRNRLTTACISIGGKRETLVVGPFHLVEYTYFLLREFFPQHDEICRVLGGLYLTALQKRKIDGGKQKELQESLKQLSAIPLKNLAF